MSIHNEIEFENDICAHLAANGWLYDGNADAQHYNRAKALYSADVMVWVQHSQPEAWDWLKSQGTKAEGMLLERIRKALDTHGTLEVLGISSRNGKNRTLGMHILNS